MFNYSVINSIQAQFSMEVMTLLCSDSAEFIELLHKYQITCAMLLSQVTLYMKTQKHHD